LCSSATRIEENERRRAGIDHNLTHAAADLDPCRGAPLDFRERHDVSVGHWRIEQKDAVRNIEQMATRRGAVTCLLYPCSDAETPGSKR